MLLTIVPITGHFLVDTHKFNRIFKLVEARPILDLLRYIFLLILENHSLIYLPNLLGGQRTIDHQNASY